MTAILMSIQPTWVSKILNGKKTLEIRKSMPKCDLPIDVYIYCTKGNGVKDFITIYKHVLTTNEISCHYINGTVVAKFTLNKVEEIRTSPMFVGGCPHYYLASCETTKEFYEKSCLDYDTLYDYLKGEQGYAWHIDNLEIFDKPKELKEFVPYCKLCGSTSCCNCKHAQRDSELRFISCDKVKPLTRAPQSWCYVEI